MYNSFSLLLPGMRAQHPTSGDAQLLPSPAQKAALSQRKAFPQTRCVRPMEIDAGQQTFIGGHQNSAISRWRGAR